MTCDDLCPKYSSGFGEGQADPRPFITATDRPCDVFNRIGDDYTTHNLKWLQLTAFAVRGWTDGYRDMDCPWSTCGGVACGTQCSLDEECENEPEEDDQVCQTGEVADPGIIVVQFWDAAVTPPVSAAGVLRHVSQQVCDVTADPGATMREAWAG